MICCVHRRRPPENGRQGFKRCWGGKGGGGETNDTDGEEVKEREETGKLQGTGNLGDLGEGVEIRGDQIHRRTVKIANLKIGPESRGILIL